MTTLQTMTKIDLSTHPILAYADLHFGNTKVDASVMYSELMQSYKTHISQASLLTHVGDYFHTLMSLNTLQSSLALSAIVEMCQIVKRENPSLPIRIVRGTYTHDRDQERYFKTFGESLGLDVKVIETLEIEYIESIGLKMLYIPDNLNYTEKELKSEVKELFYKAGWDKCDVCLYHGYCKHVLPPQAPPPKLLLYAKTLEKIADLTLCGHIHQPSSYKSIHYIGSFDRTAHGEEEKKGYVTCTKSDNAWHVKRHENVHASLKYTYTYREGETVDTFLQWVKDHYSTYASHQYLRIACSDRDIRAQLQGALPDEYALIVSFKDDKKQKMQELDIDAHSLLASASDIVIPTEDNIVELVEEFISENQLYHLSRETLCKYLE